MLYVKGLRPREYVEIGSRRGGFVQLRVQIGDQPKRPAVTDLRALMVADLVRRVLEEIDGCQVFVTLTSAGADAAWCEAIRQGPLARDLADLWIAMPAVAGSETPQGRVNLVVSSQPPDAISTDGTDIPAVGVGEVALAGTAAPALADVVADWSAEALATGVDPLAVRLVLMRHDHAEPVSLTRSQLDDADRTLRRWRAAVATWAGEPSEPLQQELVDDAYQALRSGLDTGQVLDALARLERDRGMASGAKFETFAHLDRFLALNLAASLGSATSD